MHKTQKEQVVAELTERLKTTEAIIVADYRGLTNSQLVGLRAKLREHGAKLQVVKNTLTRRAAEAAGTESLLALLEGPSAIAFVETDGDPIAVAKALSGGVLSGKTMTGEDVEELSKLPPVDTIKSQLVGVIIAPLTQLLALIQAPVQDLVGLIDARITQLDEGGQGTAAEAEVPSEVPDTVEAEAAIEAPVEEAPAEAAAADEPVADEAVAEEPTPDEPEAAAEVAEPEATADESEAAASDDTETE